MDFIVGILLIIIVILIMVNFASVSLSDSSIVSGTCSSNNNNNNNSGSNMDTSAVVTPVPLVASDPSAVNGIYNLEAQTYDYRKYFFVP